MLSGQGIARPAWSPGAAGLLWSSGPDWLSNGQVAVALAHFPCSGANMWWDDDPASDEMQIKLRSPSRAATWYCSGPGGDTSGG